MTSSTHAANPKMITKWAQRDKCWMCKRKFERPVLLPVSKPRRGQFKPNVNVEVLSHMSDTHGLPPDTVWEWIIGSVYGLELNEVGFKDVQHYFD